MDDLWHSHPLFKGYPSTLVKEAPETFNIHCIATRLLSFSTYAKLVPLASSWKATYTFLDSFVIGVTEARLCIRFVSRSLGGNPIFIVVPVLALVHEGVPTVTVHRSR
ncbi:hypothetical protein HAX54_046372, partial [Datura stramonium]|nr:hypothetical protein [Datura stramonium]